MPARTAFYPMTWGEDDIRNFTGDPRYIGAGMASTYAQYDPRTVAPYQVLRDPSLYSEQDMDLRASRGSTSSGNSDETKYAVFSSLPRSRAHPQQPLERRHSISRRTHNGIEVEDRTRVQIPKAPRYYCDFPGCVDEKGNRSSVSRKADMKRHVESVHSDPRIDCKYRRCDRKGKYGFRRPDHYHEHLRGYHGQKSEKRRGS